jgi:hypothetical protein
VFVTYHEATGIAHGNWRFTRIFIRVGIGVKISHRKSFGDSGRVPEREHRNSFGKTEKLFQGIPLGQIGFCTHLEFLGGCQNCSGNFLDFSEKKPKNVLELPEPVWLLFADENHFTEKLFWSIPLSQIGFGTCLIILGGCQNYSRNFWEFSWIKTENVPELPEPLWFLFADENH